jgi:hypothetical protein
MPRPALFIPITKIDEEKQEVYGVATQEIRDRDNEIFDYDGSKPYIEQWSKNAEDGTAGKSKGNLRAMHRNISAGILRDLSFDDTAKKIDVCAYVNDPVEWQKVMDGNYTGFSFSGKVMKRWKDPVDRTMMRYIANPTELSLADLPCVPTATFTMIKIGGASEERSFKIAAREDTSAATGESKYGDVTYADAKNKKYPIETKAHVRAALSYWGQAKNRAKYSTKDQATIGRNIRAAARKFGIGDVTEKAMLRGDFSKGMYEIGQMANLVESTTWAQRSAQYEREREEDDSEIPDRLADWAAEGADILLAMTGEEVEELRALLGLDANEEGEAAGDTKETSATKVAITDEGTMKDDIYLKTLKVALSSPEEFAKAVGDPEFAKAFAQKHIAKVSDLVDHAEKCMKIAGDSHKAMKAHVEKLSGLHASMTGEGEGGAGDDEGEADKVAKAAAATAGAGEGEFAKALSGFEKRLKAAEDRATAAEGENATLRKTAEDLASTGAQLVQQLSGKGGVLRVVDKGADVAGGTTATGETVDKTATGDKAPPTTFKGAFKESFLSPKIEGLPPEMQPKF